MHKYTYIYRISVQYDVYFFIYTFSSNFTNTYFKRLFKNILFFIKHACHAIKYNIIINNIKKER